MGEDPTKTGFTRRGAVSAVSLLGALAGGSASAAAQTPAPAPAGETPCLLYPHPSPTRSARDLSGLWRFKLDPEDRGERERWFDAALTDARHIPVPCSWNDLYDDAQNYFGAAWYETELWVDGEPADRRLVLRFGSAVYHARVWLNGKYLGEHVGGYLPFAFDVTGVARRGEANRLMVRVENQLKLDRVPAAPDVHASHFYQIDYPQTAYDFFPYAGLNRPVVLCALPAVHVQDVTVVTSFEGGEGLVDVELKVSGSWSGRAQVTLEGGPSPVTGTAVVANGAARLRLRIPSARAWSPSDPHLYRMSVAIGDQARPLDVYRMKVGVRTVRVDGERLLVNEQPVFLTGFGKHEDFPIHGKGLDLPVLVRDFELLRWIGANSFRTSHYPYSEVALQLADEYGFMVIAETPAVSLGFSDPAEVIEARARQLEQDIHEMIRRDKNHPAIILWSLANEPIPKPFHTTDEPAPGAVEAGARFFARAFATARKLDASRPVAIVSVQGGPAEWVGQGDVICTNSYNGWYAASGRLDEVEGMVAREVEALHARHGRKPIIYTEFGADALAGDHAHPAEMWSEEYQAELIAAYWSALRKHPYVVGTHPWAFADFKTPQSLIRVGGLNQKGVFTRDRRPKLAAHRLRELWSPLKS